VCVCVRISQIVPYGYLGVRGVGGISDLVRKERPQHRPEDLNAREEPYEMPQQDLARSARAVEWPKSGSAGRSTRADMTHLH